jgi:hypothetical protein
MSKFKIGDTVRCVVNGAAYKPKALGYKPDKEFIVDSIRKYSDGYVYFPKNEHCVYECDLMLVKTLPKSFACQNTNQKLWDKYINWLNNLNGGVLDGKVPYIYYGIVTSGTVYTSSFGGTFDTIMSLEEWDEIVNNNTIKEEVMEKTHSITRSQLEEIHNVACTAWRDTIVKYANRNPFGNTIEFTQKEVDAMFAASNDIQIPVLEGIFGKQSKDIDLSTGIVDGKTLFDNNRTLDNTLICVRDYGDYKYKAFILNGDYNWEIVKDRSGNPCLVPTRK